MFNGWLRPVGVVCALGLLFGMFLSSVNVNRPNRRPSAQTTRPPISSVRPFIPRNVATDRSGTTRFASPP